MNCAWEAPVNIMDYGRNEWDRSIGTTLAIALRPRRRIRAKLNMIAFDVSARPPRLRDGGRYGHPGRECEWYKLYVTIQYFKECLGYRPCGQPRLLRYDIVPEQFATDGQMMSWLITFGRDRRELPKATNHKPRGESLVRFWCHGMSRTSVDFIIIAPRVPILRAYSPATAFHRYPDEKKISAHQNE